MGVGVVVQEVLGRGVLGGGGGDGVGVRGGAVVVVV